MEQDESGRSLRSRVSLGIRKMILSGELRPGERLLQQRLAKHFGVSQSIVREALLETQFTGLVASVDGIGTSVAAIDLAQLTHAYEIREVFEGLAARLCCMQANATNVRELTEIANQIHALGIAGKDQERAQLDRHFHERIINMSRNSVLERLSGGYHIVRLVVLKSTPHDQIRAEHLAIVDAIKANNPDEAERAARRHVLTVRELIRRQIEANDFIFPWETRHAQTPAKT